MIDNMTKISISIYLRDAINNLKEEGYQFNHIAKMDIITLAHKRDLTHDFHINHIMSAFEWKLNGMINKGKNLFINFPQNWRHPSNRKFESYRF